MTKLLKYLHTCKKESILAPLFVVFEVFGEVLIPLFMGKLIDEGVRAYNIQLIYQYGITMIIIALLSLFFGIMASRYAAILANEFGRNLRNAQFEKLQTYSFENIDKFQTSSLVTRLTLDVSFIQNALQMNIRFTFRAPAMLLFSIVTSFIVGGYLGLIFVVIIPILAFGLWFIMYKAFRFFTRMFKNIDKLNLTVQENLIGIRTVKSYVREDYEVDKFNTDAKAVADDMKRAEKWIAFNSPLMTFSITICFVLLSYFGSRLMVFEGLSEGSFANVITYVMQVFFSLMLISQVFLMLVISRASVERINEVLNEKPLITEVPNPVTKFSDSTIEFKNVSFSFNETKKVLNNISFTIKPNEFVGIFGATGTGKSTLVQLISRLYDTNEGEILIGGVNVKDYALNTLRENVITVLQKNVLFSGSVRENIKWGKEDATDEEIISALKTASAYDFIFGIKENLDYKVEQGGVNFSGGQRQRLCIARGLVGNPKILILDDSTSALDTKTDANVKKALKNDAKGMTKIIIAQRLSSIEDADKIIILDNDGINEIGTHNTLYNHNKIYTEVYDAQRKGKEVN